MTAFPETYGEARKAFRDAAQAKGARLFAALIPGAGAEGEALTIDCAVLGAANAPGTLLSVSGVHGAEAYAGSAAQCAFLAVLDTAALAPGCKIVLVHALNPWGMSHRSRCNEGNVDLSRNFRDFRRPAAGNPVYDRIRPVVCPEIWCDDLIDEAGRLFEALSRELGAAAALTGFTGGQYDDPQGLSFGGLDPTPSHLALQRLIERECADCRHLALVEWHTGLGVYGEALIVGLRPPGDPLRARTEAWWAGAVQSDAEAFEGGEKPSWSGLLFEGLCRFLPETEIAGGPVEFGTVSNLEAFEAVMIDRWLRFGAGPADPGLRRSVQARLRACYDPPDPAWRESVIRQGRALHVQALAGLQAWT